MTRHIVGFPINLSRQHRPFATTNVKAAQMQCQQCGTRNQHVHPYRPGQQAFCQPSCQEVRAMTQEEKAS
jgi:hypothetical protein